MLCSGWECGVVVEFVVDVVVVVVVVAPSGRGDATASPAPRERATNDYKNHSTTNTN